MRGRFEPDYVTIATTTPGNPCLRGTAERGLNVQLLESKKSKTIIPYLWHPRNLFEALKVWVTDSDDRSELLQDFLWIFQLEERLERASPGPLLSTSRIRGATRWSENHRTNPPVNLCPHCWAPVA